MELAVFDQPCQRGSECNTRNLADPQKRCRYRHVASDKAPLFYTLNYETGAWSETDFKKALDSGVMRDSVSGERVSVVPGGHARYTITFANGKKASRFMKQLRVPGEDD